MMAGMSYIAYRGEAFGDNGGGLESINEISEEIRRGFTSASDGLAELD